MLSAAFPHLLPKACLGKTVIPLAEGHGDSFFLSGPSSSPWGWSCWSCWSGWSLVPTEHSQQLGQGRPSQGLVHKSSLFSPKNLTFGALVLLGHRMNPIHSLSCPQIFLGRVGVPGSEAGCPDAQVRGIPGNADFTLLLLLLCPPAKSQASHGS